MVKGARLSRYLIEDAAEFVYDYVSLGIRFGSGDEHARERLEQ